MSRVTSKSIGQAIEKFTGIPDVIVVRGEGYHYFCSDNDTIGTWIAGWYSSSVYVYNMNHQDLAGWIHDFCDLASESIADLLWSLFADIIEAYCQADRAKKLKK